MITCPVCNEIKYYPSEGKDMCGQCSNDLYFRKLKRGEIVELKIDMTKIRQSTYQRILEMIEEDKLAKPTEK